MLIYHHRLIKQSKSRMISTLKMRWFAALFAGMLPVLAIANDAHSSEILSLYGAHSAKSDEMFAPYTGDYVADSYYNRAIASYSLQQMNGALPQILDPWVNHVVSQMSADMNGYAKRQDLLSVVVIRDNSINAFAVPGGLIGINAGVISAADSMDEVASVLAHEIAHLSLRHYERTADDKGKLMAMQIGGLLAAIAASSASGDAAAAMMIGSQTLGMESQAKNSRAHEREADRVGMQILSAAGYDARAMPRFFDTLQQKIKLNQHKSSYVPSFAQSHPFTLERLSEATSRAAQYPIPNTHSQTRQKRLFDLLLWRVRYLNDAGEEELRQASKVSQGAKLAYSAYLADKRRFDEAQSVFDGVDKSLQSEPLYCITEAHIWYEKGDFQAAAQTLSACHAVYPERRDLTLYLADSLIYADNSARAIQLLTPLSAVHHDLVVWDLLQRAYEMQAKQSDSLKNDFTANALYARANKQMWRGQFEGALVSLGQAKSLAGRNEAIIKKINELTTDVKSYRDFKP